MRMNIKPKILVADDEIAILHVISIKLKKAGFDIVGAANGVDAYKKAINELPDIIITDYLMPGLSGLELCSKLNHHAATASIPRIMLTSHSYDINSEKLKKAGIVKCLEKPFSPKALLEEIETLAESIYAIPTC